MSYIMHITLWALVYTIVVRFGTQRSFNSKETNGMPSPDTATTTRSQPQGKVRDVNPGTHAQMLEHPLLKFQ